MVFIFFDPFGRYRRVYGATDQSKPAVVVAGGQL